MKKAREYQEENKKTSTHQSTPLRIRRGRRKRSQESDLLVGHGLISDRTGLADRALREHSPVCEVE
jgi:hypothetical protein